MFLETTRKRIVAIAGEVITHARSIEIRMMNYIYKEVCRVKAIMNSVFTVDANRLSRMTTSRHSSLTFL
ncbi:MAG: hypothetical protein HOP07_14455 [Bacteriovoracaceae bacterium]|nr:hypothetical protein [Bacteriovoracaceae bacterium]